MECKSFLGSLVQSPCDCLVIGLHDNWEESADAAEIDAATSGLLKRLVESEEISTKPLKTSMLLAPPGIASKILVTVGLGNRVSMHPSVFFRASATAMKLCSSKKRGIVRFAGFAGSALELRGAVAGSVAGCVGQDLFRKDRNTWEPDKIEWQHVAAEVVTQGQIIGKSINATRRLVNLPPNYIYPESLADAAVKLAHDCSLQVEVWDRAKLTKERCGALLGVAQGSVREPRLVILQYRGNGEAPPTALVGKGVTFDSGGYSIKPTDGMLTMKGDMAGAATVLGIMGAAA
ncbi:MAG: M17 family peptidase N-terminal domain-containing protein, partial [Pirellula sp.]